MPRTGDSIVDAHQAATRRRRAGQPSWEIIVKVSDLWRNDMLSFTERRDALVTRLRATRWASLNDRMGEIFDNLADADDTGEFDNWWDQLYDEADRDRVWIDTVG